MRSTDHRVRGALLGGGGLAVVLATAALAQSGDRVPSSVAARDAKADARTNLDLTRVGVARGSDGRVRASITLAEAWTGDDLLADSGPPGSVCLRVWTVAEPPDMPPDHLVCATADEDGELRGTVLQERPNQLPRRVARATVSRPSERSVRLRFSQSSVGRPAFLAVGAETTRAGCPRVSCIDTAPDAPRTLRVRLRKPASTNQP